jgi:hypothetical protein
MRALAVLAALLATACECGGERESTPEPTAPPPPSRTSTITGIVRLAPGTELPQYPQSPVQLDGRPAIPASCTPPRTVDRTPVTISEETGGLVGLSIVIAASEEAGWPQPGEPVTHEVAIRDCRLTPAIVVATRGDRLRLTNETDYAFFPDLGEGMLQYRTEPREIELDEGGLRTIRCGFAAPCGQLEVITLYHPVHGTTGPDGRFRIENVPHDRELSVTAWHPLFEEATVTAAAGTGDVVEVEIEIRPAPPPPEAPPVEPTPLDPNAPF